MTQLWDHFQDARWFSGKGRGGVCTAITPLDPFAQRDGDDPVMVRSEIATITYPDGGTEHYQLVLSYRPEALASGAISGAKDPLWGQAHDALADPEALAMVVAAVASNATTALTWSSVIRQPELMQGPIRVFGGEQSNTNLMIGETALLKLFRKLEPGRNLDIAVHDALGRAHVTAAAQLIGWVEAQIPSESGQTTADLGMVVEQFAQAQDGWPLALASAAGADQGSDFTDQAAALGRALAEVHRALADTFPAGRTSGDEVAAVMERRLEAALDVAPALADHAQGLRAVFARLRGHELNTQHIHGDFHLGQTLLTQGRWRVIDFEGEPMKTRDERWAPDSKWRDVAGMARSLGYAGSGAPDPGSPAALAWVEAARSAFIEAYSPGATAAQLDALAAYEADRAIYEVVYETRNRPDWVQIPLRAIAQLSRPAPPTQA